MFLDIENATMEDGGGHLIPKSDNGYQVIERPLMTRVQLNLTVSHLCPQPLKRKAATAIFIFTLFKRKKKKSKTEGKMGLVPVSLL